MNIVLPVVLFLAAGALLMTSDIRAEQDNPGNHPYLVVVDFNYNGQSRNCGGAVIAPNLVLTSAHCLFNTSVVRAKSEILKPANVEVSREYVEEATRTIVMHTFDVAELIPHSVWSNAWASVLERASHDLGLIRLKTPIDYASTGINSVILASNEEYSKSGCVLVGWNTRRTHAHKVKLALKEEAMGVYSSKLKMWGMDGSPVLCPSLSSNSIVQVAVVSEGDSSMMTMVSPRYEWLQSYLSASGSSGSIPSGSGQNPSGSIPSGSGQNPSGPIPSGSGQNPPGPLPSGSGTNQYESMPSGFGKKPSRSGQNPPEPMPSGSGENPSRPSRSRHHQSRYKLRRNRYKP